MGFCIGLGCVKGVFSDANPFSMWLKGAEGGKNLRGSREVPEGVNEDDNIECGGGRRRKRIDVVDGISLYPFNTKA